MELILQIILLLEQSKIYKLVMEDQLMMERKEINCKIVIYWLDLINNKWNAYCVKHNTTWLIKPQLIQVIAKKVSVALDFTNK